MDINEYIQSGILEEYCLGLLNDAERSAVIEMLLLYPQLRMELNSVELALERFAEENAVEVTSVDLKDKILQALDVFDLNNLPLIDKHSDHLQWLKAFQHLIPSVLHEDMAFELLRHDDRITQTLIASRINVPEESHDDLLESFLILQGECECTIGDHVFRAGPGTLIEIPLNTHHDVRVISPFVVAVLQHQMV